MGQKKDKEKKSKGSNKGLWSTEVEELRGREPFELTLLLVKTVCTRLSG